MRKRKCTGRQAKEEESVKEKKKTEFDRQALDDLIESRDDNCDRPLHKLRAAGCL